MLLYLAAMIFATVISFAWMPVAINTANRVHITNGREPNAGVAFIPGLIAIIGMWSLATWLLDHFLERNTTWIVLVGGSTLLLAVVGVGALLSIRSYRRFLDKHEVAADCQDGKTKTPHGDQRL